MQFTIPYINSADGSFQLFTMDRKTYNRAVGDFKRRYPDHQVLRQSTYYGQGYTGTTISLVGGWRLEVKDFGTTISVKLYNGDRIVDQTLVQGTVPYPQLLAKAQNIMANMADRLYS